MVKRQVKINSSNTQVNFNSSAEIGYWSKKYNTSLDEIQEMFKDSGYSISKTIAKLQEKTQSA